MPPLYAGTLYQGLYQVYATRAPLGFIPGRSSSWEEAPAAGACPFPSPSPAPSWRPPAPTGGLGEKIGAPPPLGGFRPNPPRGGFTPIRRWWARWARLAPTGGLGETIGAHESSFFLLLYDGLCRGISLLYAAAL